MRPASAPSTWRGRTGCRVVELTSVARGLFAVPAVCRSRGIEGPGQQARRWRCREWRPDPPGAHRRRFQELTERIRPQVVFLHGAAPDVLERRTVPATRSRTVHHRVAGSGIRSRASLARVPSSRSDREQVVRSRHGCRRSRRWCPCRERPVRARMYRSHLRHVRMSRPLRCRDLGGRSPTLIICSRVTVRSSQNTTGVPGIARPVDRELDPNPDRGVPTTQYPKMSPLRRSGQQYHRWRCDDAGHTVGLISKVLSCEPYFLGLLRHQVTLGNGAHRRDRTPLVLQKFTTS